MTAPDARLRREIRAFNRHCWFGAAGALFFAWLTWLAAFAIFSGLVLLFATVIGGHDAAQPAWRVPVFLVLAGISLICAGLLAWARRFRPPPDRPIIGWHLVLDALLFPARLTLAVGEHLDARIRLSRYEFSETARLLELFVGEKRIATHALGMDFPDGLALRKGLEALLALGWIDLHRGEGEGFYLLRSSRSEDAATSHPDGTEV